MTRTTTTVNCTEPKFEAMKDQFDEDNETTVKVTSKVVERFMPRTHVEFTYDSSDFDTVRFVTFMQKTWN